MTYGWVIISGMLLIIDSYINQDVQQYYQCLENRQQITNSFFHEKNSYSVSIFLSRIVIIFI